MQGRIYERKGQVQEAQEAFRDAVVLFDQWWPDVTEHTGQDYGDYGLALEKVGRKKDADESFRTAVELGYTLRKSTAILRLANSQEQGLFSEAEQFLRKAVDLTIDTAPIYKALAEMLEAQKRIDEAISAYQKAISVLFSNGLWDEVITVVDHILALKPNDLIALTYKGEVFGQIKSL